MLNGLDLFSGIGGISLALQPWVRTVCYVEIEPYCRHVLTERMRDGQLDDAPIWDDVRTFDPEPWRGLVDIVSGGFPCQDISTASRGRGGGFGGKHTGLWSEMRRIVADIAPDLVFIENIGRWRAWLPNVRRDLHGLGYSVLPLRMRASEIGAPFAGARVFALAEANGYRESTGAIYAEMAELPELAGPGWPNRGTPPPCALGVADGVPARVDRLRGLGNSVVPACAREAFGRLIGNDPTRPR